MKPPFHLRITAALLCFFCLHARAQKVSIAPEPGWISPHSYQQANYGEQEAEDGYLDIAYERQMLVAPEQTYVKKVFRVLTKTGIENISKVSVNYDPTYEQLVFHTIHIIRDGKKINQLSQGKIKTIQREEEIDQNLYDGSLTAIIILEDLRVDDILEYSFTIKGSNPVFKGKFSKSFYLNFSIPVGDLFYKVITPSDRPLNIKSMGTDLQPATKTNGKEITYEWSVSGIAAVRTQDRLPVWYTPYSFVMLSEYQDWKQVNDWALPLFPEQKKLSAALAAKVTEIQTSNRRVEEQVAATLKFVQDEVRYMGIEVGANSHQPAHPDKIFARRYGDCKDKSYLLCTMLKAIGVEAYPVLINTADKKSLLEELPGANLFDHVTVKAIVNGKTYWFDPTISYQRGSIDKISYPDYQAGLVVAPGTTGLTVITNKEPGMVDVKEEFMLDNITQSARLRVTTRLTGAFADETRSDFHESSRFEMLNSYRKFYAAYYEDIKGDSVTFEDDPEGAFIVKEFYTIENLWESKAGSKNAYFSPYVISSIMKEPVDKKRKMPFSIQYPAKYHEEVIVNLWSNWNITESKDYVNTDQFRLNAAFTYSNKTVSLVYDYEALQDHVPADQMQEYTAALDKFDNNFFFHLTDPGASSEAAGSSKANESSIDSIMAKLIAVVIVGGLITFFIRRRRNNRYI